LTFFFKEEAEVVVFYVFSPFCDPLFDATSTDFPPVNIPLMTFFLKADPKPNTFFGFLGLTGGLGLLNPWVTWIFIDSIDISSPDTSTGDLGIFGVILLTGSSPSGSASLSGSSFF
jgi:hypothetical protein